MRHRWTHALLAASVAMGIAAGTANAQTKTDLKKVDATINKGFDWLSTERDKTGAWRSEYGPGITGLVVTAYLKHPQKRFNADSPEVKAALDWMASLQNADGSIYDADAEIPLPNYNTSTSLMALSAANSPRYAEVIKKAQQFLMRSQTDEGEGATPEDSNYGGIGYGSDPSVRDMSNLNMALQALKDSGTPKDADVWAKAITFLERVQNNSETNDQSYSGDDGGFMYSPGVSKADNDAQGRPRSYATMTYAGLLAFIYANVDKNDPRVQAAYDWLGEHWSLEENFPIGQQGLYYGYVTIAKALKAYGEPTFETAGGKGDWYKELSDHLAAKQTPGGFWPPNEADRWFEGDPVLVTAYSLLALVSGYPSK